MTCGTAISRQQASSMRAACMNGDPPMDMGAVNQPGEEAAAAHGSLARLCRALRIVERLLERSKSL
jgi:hypothetical protein